jgi:hypothetical protein
MLRFTGAEMPAVAMRTRLSKMARELKDWLGRQTQPSLEQCVANSDGSMHHGERQGVASHPGARDLGGSLQDAPDCFGGLVDGPALAIHLDRYRREVVAHSADSPAAASPGA